MRRAFYAFGFQALVLLLLATLPGGKVFAQTPADPFDWEIKPSEISPVFVEKWNSPANSNQPEAVSKQVRLIYLAPSDRAVRDDYRAAVADAGLHLQDFYQRELGNNNAYSLHSPIIEVYQTAHTAGYYQTHQSGASSPQSQWFWENTLNDGFALTGGGFNDPNNRWIFYIDADPLCGQGIGGTSGVAVLSGNDFKGLVGGINTPRCSTEQPDRGGKYRWIGGLGHELGHAFNLPHPPGCDQGNCQGGQTAYNSLMYVGYAYYPNTYFLPADKTTLLGSGFFAQMDLREPRMFDYDGDRKTDYSVWRPSNGGWYNILSSSGANTYFSWGSPGDKIVPGDYDGDRKTDLAVWRPSTGIWYVVRSSDSTFSYTSFGSNGDVPVAADYDGDRITDVAVWRPNTGIWYSIGSAANAFSAINFGLGSDLPVAADYNGDKRADIAVFRPSQNDWYIYNQYLSYYYANPQVNYSVVNYGSAGDKLVPNDYDGDGKAEPAVFRPSDGNWYYLASSNNSSQGIHFGANGDIPAPGDYDNDDKADFSVWRPDNTVFYVLRSSDLNFQASSLGLNTDIPTASAFVR